MAIHASERALVVLMHGFLGGRIQLVPMASRLSAKYDVLNYGYRSRADTIEGHAQTLLDTMEARVKALALQRDEATPTASMKKQDIHFVTHSFGGVVLHRAFSDGLGDILGISQGNISSKCIMLAPPLRGAQLARVFHRENVRGMNFMKNGLHSLAEFILGTNCGAQLMSCEAEWFEESMGTIPNAVDVLVISGQMGRINPLIKEPSDGVVAASETMLNRPHFRKNVTLTHNLLLYSGEVWSSVGQFLDGETVGELQVPS